MADDQAQPVTGTLLRDASGAIYFLPDEDLERFRLVATDVESARAALQPTAEAADPTPAAPPAVQPVVRLQLFRRGPEVSC